MLQRLSSIFTNVDPINTYTYLHKIAGTKTRLMISVGHEGSVSILQIWEERKWINSKICSKFLKCVSQQLLVHFSAESLQEDYLHPGKENSTKFWGIWFKHHFYEVTIALEFPVLAAFEIPKILQRGAKFSNPIFYYLVNPKFRD